MCIQSLSVFTKSFSKPFKRHVESKVCQQPYVMLEKQIFDLFNSLMFVCLCVFSMYLTVLFQSIHT